MKIREKLGDWFKIFVLLLDEAIVLVIIFAVLHFIGIDIPLIPMIILGLVIAVLVFMIHVKVIPSFHWKQITGREGMVGQRGTVVRPLSPVGTIYIKGENWKAKTDGESIEVDENVEVVGIEGLVLKVKGCASEGGLNSG